MAAPKGNQFWKIRSRSGPKTIFGTPEKLWSQSVNYFEWCEKHPLMASEVVKFQGTATLTKVPKLRAMTITGLCIYLGITTETWYEYKKTRKDLSDIITQVDNIIRTQKFEGAAAELLNPNIIARDLGLVDKQDRTNKIGLDNRTLEEIDNRIKAINDKLNANGA